jgi:hypothetical protein
MENPIADVLDKTPQVHFMDISIVEQFGETFGRSATSAVATTAKEPKGIGEGSRNSTLTSLAGSLRRKGLGDDTILAMLREANGRECKPALSDDEVKRIAKSITRYPFQEQQESSAGRTAVITNLEDVEPESVNYLWTNRIPYAKLTFLEGDPAAGKSFVSMAIAAAETRGVSLPDDEGIVRTPGKVLLLTAEDGLADTVVPRLVALGADLTRVRHLTAVRDIKGNEQFFSLQKDLAALEAELATGNYTLVITDPLNSYIGSINMNSDVEVRSVLTPFTKLGEKYGVAVIVVRHLTKGKRDRAMYRGQGSIGFTGIARAVHLVGANPKKTSERIMVSLKNSNNEKPQPMAFEILPGGKFEWRGVVDITEDDLLSPEPIERNSDALEDAKAFLLDILSDGAKPVDEIMKARRQAGISKSTLERAKDALGIESHKSKVKNGGWVWEKVSKASVKPSWTPSIFDLAEAENLKIPNDDNTDDLNTFNKPNAPEEMDKPLPSPEAQDEIDEEEYDEYEAAGVTAENLQESSPEPAVEEKTTDTPPSDGVSDAKPFNAFHQIMKRKTTEQKPDPSVSLI